MFSNPENKKILTINQNSTTFYRVKGKTKYAVIPKLVRQMFPKSFKILEYGADPEVVNQLSLKLLGFDVDAYNFGQNWREGMQKEVLPAHYDLIYASNVINNWSTVELVNENLVRISRGLKNKGTFLTNYPKSPRYMADNTDADMIEILWKFFTDVRILPKNVYYCKK